MKIWPPPVLSISHPRAENIFVWAIVTSGSVGETTVMASLSSVLSTLELKRQLAYSHSSIELVSAVENKYPLSDIIMARCAAVVVVVVVWCALIRIHPAKTRCIVSPDKGYASWSNMNTLAYSSPSVWWLAITKDIGHSSLVLRLLLNIIYATIALGGTSLGHPTNAPLLSLHAVVVNYSTGGVRYSFD